MRIYSIDFIQLFNKFSLIYKFFLFVILMSRVSILLFLLICLCGGLLAQNPRENFKFAKYKFDNGDFKGSMEYLDKALVEDPLYINALYLRAESNYELGNYYSSISDINSIFKIEKTAASFTNNYYLTRGKSYLSLKDFPNALVDFEKSNTLSANNAELHYYNAKLGLANRNTIKALEYLETAIRINPDNPKYYAFRTEINITYLKPLPDSKGYYDVLDDINLAISLDPDQYEYYQIRSNFLKSMGEVNDAKEDYNKMIELSPHDSKAYTERGVINLHKYEFNSAVTDFTNSILIDPDNGRNYRFRGLCYNNMNDYSNAYEDFSKSIDLLSIEYSDASNKSMLKKLLAETYLLRGHCLILMGSNGKACNDFLMAHNLGIKKGLNYYRRFCATY